MDFSTPVKRPKPKRLRKFIKRISFLVLVIFAIIGMAFSGVYVAMQHKMLDVPGSIADRNQFFGAVPKTTNTSGCTQNASDPKCSWNQSAEWGVIKDGLIKDSSIIIEVSNKTGIPARLITATVIPEQLRFFTSNRETFKKYFEPLKVLGSMTNFSLGISGIKQDTATEIERNTVDINSPFYPGKGFSDLIKYKVGAAHDSEQYNRLSNSKDHYYGYLYTALFIKEISAQWAKEGYDISARPDIAVTLFNIGFKASKPKDTPKVGGSTIGVNNRLYRFGELGSLYYQSDELLDTFPRY